MKTQIFAAMVVVSSLVSACTENNDLLRQGEPAGMLNLVNGSETALTAVMISECSDDDYGVSRLESGEKVLPGTSRRWAVSEGCYDVKIGSDTPEGISTSDSRIHIEAERIHNLTVN